MLRPRFCVFCEAPINDGARFCVICGGPGVFNPEAFRPLPDDRRTESESRPASQPERRSKQTSRA